MNLRDRLLNSLLMMGDAYGLELIDRLDLGWFSRLRLYPTLRELERKGLVTSYESGDAHVLATRGGRPRRYYSHKQHSV